MGYEAMNMSRIVPLRTGRWFTLVLAAAVLAGGCISLDDGTPGGPLGDGTGGDAAAAAAGGTGGSGNDSAGIGLTTVVVSPADINQGFIGGACKDHNDCDYTGGFCLTEAQGFPNGMCSADCSLYCPDQTDAVTTFCVAPSDMDTTAADGLCTIYCDYGLSSTGCRPGYQCQPLSRNTEPETIRYVCVPGEDDPFELTACHQQLLDRGIGFVPAVNPLDSPDGHPELICDIEDPLWIAPVLHGVAYRPGGLGNDPKAIFTACPHGLALDDSAELLAARDTTDIVHWGVYNCRVISGTSTLSQHAFANAVDFAGFKLSDGNYYTVLDDWEKGETNPSTAGGAFLYEFAHALYDEYIYNIILTPEYNAAHEDHFHCDLTPGSHFLK